MMTSRLARSPLVAARGRRRGARDPERELGRDERPRSRRRPRRSGRERDALGAGRDEHDARRRRRPPRARAPSPRSAPDRPRATTTSNGWPAATAARSGATAVARRPHDLGLIAEQLGDEVARLRARSTTSTRGATPTSMRPGPGFGYESPARRIWTAAGHAIRIASVHAQQRRPQTSTPSLVATAAPIVHGSPVRRQHARPPGFCDEHAGPAATPTVDEDAVTGRDRRSDRARARPPHARRLLAMITPEPCRFGSRARLTSDQRRRWASPRSLLRPQRAGHQSLSGSLECVVPRFPAWRRASSRCSLRE